MTIFHVLKYPIENKIELYARDGFRSQSLLIPEIIRGKFYSESVHIFKEWADDEHIATIDILKESLTKLYIQLLNEYEEL